MSGAQGAAESELDRLRQEYESSLSWRLTRPLRAAGRVRRIARRRTRDPRQLPAAAGTRHEWLAEEWLDSWLEHFHDARLSELERACGRVRGANAFALFRDLDVDLWALLLTQQYTLYSRIRELLPDVPDPALQELWNGASGLRLAAQSAAFYRKLRERFERFGRRPLAGVRVLDYGCGWGRLTRMLARDVAPDALYGCDPVEAIIDVCRDSGVPAKFAQSSFLPSELPFSERFGLAFAFSVFTHLSEEAHEHALSALHRSLERGAILIVTIRPPAYLAASELLRPLAAQLAPDARTALSQPRYLHVAHPVRGLHPQQSGDQMHYGETVITLPYVRQRWSDRFELLDVDLLAGDVYQVMLTMRRR